MRERYLLIVGRVVINVRATTCPRCNRGTEGFCTHEERLHAAIAERIRRERDLRERARLSEMLAEMTRNRAALADSGPWDMADLAAGQRRAITWRQTLRNPHHTTGES